MRCAILILAFSAFVRPCAAQARDPATFDGVPRQHVDAPEVLPPSDAGPRAAQVSPGDDSDTDARWYGDQTLLVDGLSALLVVGGVAAYPTAKHPGDRDRASTAITVGAIGLAVGTPLVHMAHGRVGTGFASFGIRMGMVAGGAVAGVMIGGAVGGSSCRSRDEELPPCFVAGEIVGAGFAVIGAAALDASRAYEPAVAPTAAWDGHGFSLGVRGRF